MDCSARGSWCVRAVRGEGVRAHHNGMVQRLVQRLAVVVGVAVALVGHGVVHLHGGVTAQDGCAVAQRACEAAWVGQGLQLTWVGFTKALKSARFCSLISCNIK